MIMAYLDSFEDYLYFYNEGETGIAVGDQWLHLQYFLPE